MLNIINLFFNKDGDFQWSSITAIVGFLAIIISVFYNYKMIKQNKELNNSTFEGNIVSKSRIEWIQEVRNKSVDFIVSCYDFFRYIKVYDNEKDKEKIIELKSIIEKNATLLILYFGPDKGKNKNNDFIVYLIMLLSEKIINKEGYYDKKQILSLENQVDVLRDFLRIYFKTEWKRAKREISDEEVQKYLEEDMYYKRIMKIHEEGFACHEEVVNCFYSQLEDKLKQD